MIQLDTVTQTLRFEAVTGVLPAWRLAVDLDGRRWLLAEAKVTVRETPPLRFEAVFAEAGVTWAVEADAIAGAAGITLRSTLTNHSGRPVRLGRVVLFDLAGAPLSDAGDDLVGLPLPGYPANRPVFRLTDPECLPFSKIKMQFFNRTRRQALQVGFLSFQRLDTQIDFRLTGGRLDTIQAWCDFAGWQLPPDQTTPVETFILQAGDDPHAQLRRWADLAAALCNPRCWDDAPIGWLGWAWVDPLTVERYEDVLLRNARAIGRRLAGFGVNYIWISMGNLADVYPGDWTNWDTARFPSGPHRLTAALEALGIRWGVWCAPFWICSTLTEKVQEFRDAFLHNPDGTPMIAATGWEWGTSGRLPPDRRPFMYALDPSHPKTLELLRTTFETYRSWGIRYYMLDFTHCATGNIGSFPYSAHHDTAKVAGPEVYHAALQVIRQAAGDDTHLLASTGPHLHNAGPFDAIRTGSDFGEGRALYPDSYWYPATLMINSGSHWTGPTFALINQATSYYTHRKLYLNNSGNVLTVDSPIPVSDAQIHATIHAFSGASTMLGDDVERLDAARLELIKKTLPRPRAVGVPIDLFDHVHPDHPHLFHRAVCTAWGNYDVLAVYNLTEQPLHETVELARLGLAADRPYLVWEFWNMQYVGRVTGTLTTDLAPMSVRVYRFTADDHRPTLLGTDLHVLMGEMEIEQLAWDAATLTLSGRARRPAGEQGSLFLHAPPTLRAADPRGLWLAKDARDNSLIVKLALSFDAGHADFAVAFAELAPPATAVHETR